VPRSGADFQRYAGPGLTGEWGRRSLKWSLGSPRVWSGGRANQLRASGRSAGEAGGRKWYMHKLDVVLLDVHLGGTYLGLGIDIGSGGCMGCIPLRMRNRQVGHVCHHAC